MNLTDQVQVVVLTERPLLELPSSLLVNLKKNLTLLLNNPVEIDNPILGEIVREAWKEELRNVNEELFLRN